MGISSYKERGSDLSELRAFFENSRKFLREAGSQANPKAQTIEVNMVATFAASVSAYVNWSRN